MRIVAIREKTAPVVADSIGRYAHGGLLRECFIPPFKIWAIVMWDGRARQHRLPPGSSPAKGSITATARAPSGI